MKTTLDLPDDLLAELKARAARAGRDVQEVAAGLLADALRQPPASPANAPPAAQFVPKHLPLIKARPAGPAEAASLTPQEMCDFIKDVDLQLEVERFERALGHQHVDRARP